MSGPDDVAIALQGVEKHYKLYASQGSVLSEVLFGRKDYTLKSVLSDVNLTIRRGEVVGVIGKNGAGKSTLLKMIAGTLQPSAGAIRVAGRVSAILELGTGFNPAYSGRDNVVLSALMRGMSEADIKRKFDQIVAFAGLEDVIDQPFHTYSSGMQARLAFAAAVAVEADVIIIDEALAAGDIRFTARSLRRVREICESGVTALFVSHQTYHVMQMCTRAIWLDDGKVRMDGPPIEVCRAYEYEMHAAIAQDEGRGGSVGARPVPPPPEERQEQEDQLSMAGIAAPEASSPPVSAEVADAPPPVAEPEPVPRPNGAAIPAADRSAITPQFFGTSEFRIARIEMLDGAGRETTIFRFGEPFRLRVTYEALLEHLPDASCGVAAAFTSADDMQHVMYFNTNYPHSDQEMQTYDAAPFRQHRGRTGVVEATIPFLQVKAGDYLVSVGILPNTPDFHQFYEFHYIAYRISVLANGFPEPSVFYPIVEWAHHPRA